MAQGRGVKAPVRDDIIVGVEVSVDERGHHVDPANMSVEFEPAAKGGGPVLPPAGASSSAVLPPAGASTLSGAPAALKAPMVAAAPEDPAYPEVPFGAGFDDMAPKTDDDDAGTQESDVEEQTTVYEGEEANPTTGTGTSSEKATKRDHTEATRGGRALSSSPQPSESDVENKKGGSTTEETDTGETIVSSSSAAASLALGTAWRKEANAVPSSDEQKETLEQQDEKPLHRQDELPAHPVGAAVLPSTIAAGSAEDELHVAVAKTASAELAAPAVAMTAASSQKDGSGPASQEHTQELPGPSSGVEDHPVGRGAASNESGRSDGEQHSSKELAGKFERKEVGAAPSTSFLSNFLASQQKHTTVGSTSASVQRGDKSGGRGHAHDASVGGGQQLHPALSSTVSIAEFEKSLKSTDALLSKPAPPKGLVEAEGKKYSRVDVLHDIRRQWHEGVRSGRVGGQFSDQWIDHSCCAQPERRAFTFVFIQVPSTRYGYVKREEAFELFIYGRGLDAIDKPEYQSVVSSIHFLFIAMGSVLRYVDKLKAKFVGLQCLSFHRNQISHMQVYVVPVETDIISVVQCIVEY